MTPTAIITIGLFLMAIPCAGLALTALMERRRDRAKRLECLKDPINCRTILKR
mgnify:FL=1